MLPTSGFVDDVLFSSGNRPESKTTRAFSLVRQVAAPVAKSARVPPVASPSVALRSGCIKLG